jgi:toxin ParE1/3/4
MLGIDTYTFEQWGEDQAEKYLSQLQQCIQRLAENPNLGRDCGHIRPGFRRFEHDKHIVFYQLQQQELIVSRILHHAMLVERHHFDESQ